VGVLCIQRTLSRSKKSGLVSGLGAALADTLYAGIAALGISIVVSFLSEMRLGLQIAGAVLFFWVAYRIFFTNPGIQVRRQRRNPTHPLEDLLSAFVLPVQSAVLFVFVASLLVLSVAEHTTVWQVWINRSRGICGLPGLWYGLVSAVSIFRNRLRLRPQLWITGLRDCGVFVRVILLAELFWEFEILLQNAEFCFVLGLRQGVSA
jgi:threonine/homoserine/homoserine lactone efflux protein